MLRNLKAEMIKRNVTNEDIALLIKKSTRAVRGKIAEETAFTTPEAIHIKTEFFPDVELVQLFESDREYLLQKPNETETKN